MSQFPEEPLDLSLEQGFGYYPTYPGALLNKGRYKIIRKLGFGPRSSVWLASDLQREELSVALKVLTAHATAEKSQELHILEEIQGISFELPILRDHFIEQGHHGDHLCLSLNLLGPDIDTFRQTSLTKSLNVHIVKKVIASILEPLSELGETGIVHGAIKADNLLFGVPRPTLDALRPSVVLKEVTVNGLKYPIVLSEPLSHGHKWDDSHDAVAGYSIRLSNFGHARVVRKGVSWDTSSDRSLRPPEVILGADFGPKADIWLLGCTTYHLLTGTPLFPDGLDDSEHLARILAIAGDFFSTTFAQKCNRPEFFDESGHFKHPIPDTSLEAELRASKHVSENDIPAVVEFILDCLSIHAEDRQSAAELVDDDWVKNGFACSCGYCG